MNRLSSVLVASFVVWWKKDATSAPPFKYSFSSLSNVVSSWFQLEALKYVSFPMQVAFRFCFSVLAVLENQFLRTKVLSKSSKILFAMIMGRIMGNLKPYTRSEYARAVTITLGIAIFMINQTASVSLLWDAVWFKTYPNSAGIERRQGAE